MRPFSLIIDRILSRNAPNQEITDITDPEISRTDAIIRNWFVVGDSVVGKSHLVNGTPCQDNHFNRVISDGWGMAVVCDGAGSAVNSHIGSAFVAKEAIPRIFEELLNEKGWLTASTLPSQAEWEIEAKQSMRQVKGALHVFAESQSFDFASLACTAILMNLRNPPAWQVVMS